MTTRNGKIARLSREIREQLNRRMQDGEQGSRLAAWLNGLPQVRAVVAAEFHGRPIREQNLSEWRKGGYRDWLAQKEALDAASRLSREAEELQPDAARSLTEKLAPWLAARYCVAARELAAPDGEMNWKQLRELCSDVVALRRGDQNAEWLRIERERLRVEAEAATYKWKKRIIVGLETLKTYVDRHPKAKAAFDALAAQVRTPLDDVEGGP